MTLSDNRSRNAYVHFPEILGTCYGTDMRKTRIFFQAPSSLPEITSEQYTLSKTKFSICRYWELKSNHILLIYPQMVSGAFPEPFRKFSPNLIPDTIRNTYKYSQYFEDNSFTATRFLLILPIQKRLL